MPLNEVESPETMSAQTEPERSLETLTDLRREAQRMYASQFQAAVDRGVALSPQQMRVGIALLNLIRRTIMDEARMIAKEVTKQQARSRSRGSGQAVSATPSATPPATPEDFESAELQERTGAVEADFDKGVDEHRPLLANGSLLTGKLGEEPDDGDFQEYPVLVLGETRRIIVPGHFVPAPSPGDASYIRLRRPGDSG